MSDSGDRKPRARLLVVDDEKPQREMLESILSRAGFHVITAGNGREAVDAELPLTDVCAA